MFAGLDFCRVRFNLQLERPYRFRGFLGATLHSVLAMNLKALVCPAARRARCEECSSSDNCVFSYVILSPRPRQGHLHYDNQNYPHPYVLEPPLANATEEDGRLSFNLVLVGRGKDYLPMFVRSFERIRLGQGRVEARLATIDDTLKPGDTIRDSRANLGYVPASLFVSGRGFVRPLTVMRYENIRAQTEHETRERLTLNLLTPTSIRRHNEQVHALDFDVLVRALVRRFTNLAEYHCGFRPEVNKETVLDLAAQVKVEASNLRWASAGERWSMSQGVRHSLDGLKGDITFAGPLEQFLPLIRLGEYLHVGNGTSMGMGRYEVAESDK
jgi:hypothetical protein